MGSKKNVAGTVKDPTITFSTLTVDEKDYQLAFSFNSISEAESVTKCNMLSGLVELNNLGKADIMGATMLRGLLYASMLVAYPDVTLEQAGNLIRIDTIRRIIDALTEAVVNSMPEGTEKNAQAPSAS
jgi:hypothetical protein